MQYLLTVIVFFTISLNILSIIWNRSSYYASYVNNPILYDILYYLKDIIIYIVIVAILLGWSFITYIFIRKILRYLDEIVSASAQLVSPSHTKIILSPILLNTERELNRIREKALSHSQSIKESEQRKNDLVVYLAHDLKTPLTSVIGYLTLLNDEEDISDELRSKYLDITLEKALRLEDLINEFFEITRYNLSNIDLQYTKISLTRMLEQLAFEFDTLLDNRKLECLFDTSQEIMIDCDPNKLLRVFNNLLRNAIFYSFIDTTITITLDKDDDKVAITFTNKGTKIPKEKLGKIFEQFYRLDSSRATNNGGAGLGLAISKQIILLHKGTIDVTSDNDLIRFTVTIPLTVGKS